MKKTILLVASALVLLSPGVVRAQDAFNLGTASTAHAKTAAAVTPIDARDFERRAFGVSRGPVLVSLYGSLVALNALDVMTTRKAMARGGSELNPLMKAAAADTQLMTGIKISTTAVTILIIDRIGKKSRTGAIIAATAANVLMTTVVANNMRQLR